MFLVSCVYKQNSKLSVTPMLINPPATSNQHSALNIHHTLNCPSPSLSPRITSPNGPPPAPYTAPHIPPPHQSAAHPPLDPDDQTHALHPQLSNLSLDRPSPLPPAAFRCITPPLRPHPSNRHPASHHHNRRFKLTVSQQVPTTPTHRISKNRPLTPGAPRKVRLAIPLRGLLFSRCMSDRIQESASMVKGRHGGKR